MSIIIKNVLLDGKQTNVYIEDEKIKEIGSVNVEAEHKINGNGKAIIPGLINTHTHAAMSLMRSYADDLELYDWLSNKIWPLEGKLTEKDVYIGTKLAGLEMIKSGTICFNDMYWHPIGTAKAVSEMGIRGVVSSVFIDMFDSEKSGNEIKKTPALIKDLKEFKRVIPALGPHAIYTVSEESLLWAKEFSEKNNLLIHFHLSETEKEVNDCIEKNKLRPVEWLDKIGFLSDKLLAAHGIYFNDKEISLLGSNGVKVMHNPSSNMKLCSGNCLRYDDLVKARVTVSLGTDGASSNNNLDMFEEMKFAALLQKHHTGNPKTLSASQVFSMATVGGAKSLGLDAGVVEEGKLADVLLVDLKTACLYPGHNLISDLVYSANGSCVDTTICDGKILMQNRQVDGEEEILEEAKSTALNLTK